MTETRLVQHLAGCRARGLREATIEQRRRNVERFTRRVGVSPLDATPEQCEQWFNSLTIKQVSRSVELSHIRSFCAWAVRHGVIAHDPTDRIDAPRRLRRFPRPINRQRLEQALTNSADRPRLHTCLLLAAYSGLRCAEIATLRWSDVSDTAMVVTGKGGHERIVPLHPKVRAAIQTLPGDTPYVIGRCDGWQDRHLHPGRISHMMNNYLHEQGIDDTAHSLRHRFLTDFYNVSKDIRLTQDVAGHASPTTTAIYVASNIDAAAAIVEAL